MNEEKSSIIKQLIATIKVACLNPKLVGVVAQNQARRDLDYGSGMLAAIEITQYSLVKAANRRIGGRARGRRGGLGAEIEAAGQRTLRSHQQGIGSGGPSRARR
jgi:hypothetical protein